MTKINWSESLLDDFNYSVNFLLYSIHYHDCTKGYAVRSGKPTKPFMKYLSGKFPELFNEIQRRRDLPKC